MKIKHAVKGQLIFALMLFWLVGCSGTEAESAELTVSVAASLQDAMREVKAIYERENDITIHLNSGSSGSLRKQIEQGAPVDVFISASELEIEHLVDRQLMDHQTVIPLLTNKLVLIAPTESQHLVGGLEDLVDDEIKRIAVATPETVPAGKYTQEVLRKQGLWESLQDKLVFSKDVRQVLSCVETGDVEVGFVYKSDAYISSRVILVVEADPRDHSPIIYPAGVVTESTRLYEAERFLQFLQTDAVTNIFETYGFESVIP